MAVGEAAEHEFGYEPENVNTIGGKTIPRIAVAEAAEDHGAIQIRILLPMSIRVRIRIQIRILIRTHDPNPDTNPHVNLDTTPDCRYESRDGSINTNP